MIVRVTPYKASADAIKKRLTEIEKGEAGKEVLRKALNEVSLSVKKRIYSGVIGKYTIKPEVFDKSDIKRRTIGKRSAEATIRVKGKPPGIRKAYFTQDNTETSPAGAMVLRSGTVKKLELFANGRSYKAFLAEMKTGHVGIFQRIPGSRMKKNKKREAIKEIISLSTSKAAQSVYEKEIATVIQYEINFYLLKHMNAVIGGGS